VGRGAGTTNTSGRARDLDLYSLLVLTSGAKQQISVQQQQVHGRLPNPAAPLCFPSPFLQAHTHEKTRENCIYTSVQAEEVALSRVGYHAVQPGQIREGTTARRMFRISAKKRPRAAAMPCHAVGAVPWQPARNNTSPLSQHFHPW
jgi:hypothetical protein